MLQETPAAPPQPLRHFDVGIQHALDMRRDNSDVVVPDRGEERLRRFLLSPPIAGTQVGEQPCLGSLPDSGRDNPGLCRPNRRHDVETTQPGSIDVVQLLTPCLHASADTLVEHIYYTTYA